MGYKLRRRLREALGKEIAGLQRAVALEIADDANDDTRLSYATLEQLATWTAAKDVHVVRNALKRLAAAKWEFRVPLGVGKDGRALYAVPGKRLTFRVPDFEGGAIATPSAGKGVAMAPPHNSEGVAPAPREGATAPTERAPAPCEGAGATPSSSPPQLPSPPSLASDSSAAVALEPGREGGREDRFATEDQHHIAAAALLSGLDLGRALRSGERERLLNMIAPRLMMGWSIAVLRDRIDGDWDGASNRVAVLHQRLKELDAQPPTGSAASGAPRRPPWCGQCDETTRLADLDDGRVIRCPTCHPLTQQAEGVRP